MRTTRRTCVSATVLISLAAVLAFALCGCRFSDELFEIVHDQDAEEIDYDSDVKNYVQSDDADFLLEALDSQYAQENEEGLPEVDVTVPLFSNPPNTDEPVAQVYYDPDSTINRTAPTFPEMEEPPEEEEPPEDETEQQITDMSATSPTSTSEIGGLTGDDMSEGGTAAGDAPDAPGEEGDIESDEVPPDGDVTGGDESDDGEGAGDDGDNPQEEPQSAQGPTWKGPQVENESGGLLQPVAIQRMATVGEYANAVLMIGGPGCLAAADAAFTADENAQLIYSAEEWDFPSIATAWSYDEATNAYLLDMDALIASGADAVLVPEDMTLMTDDQKAELLELGFNIEYAPALDTADHIAAMVQWVAESFDLGEREDAWDAAAKADVYINDYLTRDINSIVTENGGITSYAGNDYSSSQPVSLTSNWTLFVTDWDDSAVYTAVASNNTGPDWTSQGIAIAKSGYSWSPLNYYLSVGGACNNAAFFPDATSAQTTSNNYYIWQFPLSILNPDNGLSGATIFVTPLKNSGVSSLLVGAPASFNEADPRGYEFETVLGADDFKYVICANQHITECLSAARDADTASQTGLYAAYTYKERVAGEGSLGMSGVGYVSSSGLLVEGYIGNMLACSSTIGSFCADENPPYGVKTCANGLYCDWVEGSVESFLMAFWTNDFYDTDDGDYSRLTDEAISFYKEFYDYDLTADDISTILAGRVS